MAETGKTAYAGGVFAQLEHYFELILVNPVSKVLFFNIAFFSDSINLPFIVVWLIGGSIYLTIKMGFINLRGFRHAVDVTRGKFDIPGDPGEISHFQALSSALSGTLGLGNIAGVAIAVGAGGPGAILWMIVAGFIGMSAKFVECTLAHQYRRIGQDGRVLGGPMCYLPVGFGEKGFPRVGKVMSVVFSILCIGGSLGGGNMFQANQAYAAVAGVFPSLQGRAWLFGLLMAALVAIVIIGGIKRISAAATYIVPVMCILYLGSGMWILIDHYQALPNAVASIWFGAFTPEAGYGGLLGVLIMGFRRAAFSNEAGIGSAAIAHSAAATKEPIREGIVGLLEPFIDTVVVCTMTGLIVVVTGVYKTHANDGVLMTSQAFATAFSWMPMVLACAVLLFAYATIISWSYYGERCWAYLFNTNNTLPFRILVIAATFLGSVFSLGPVLEFSDLMILGMAFPNMFGIVMLAPKVRLDLDIYWARYRSGEMLLESVNAKTKSSFCGQFLSKGKA